MRKLGRHLARIEAGTEGVRDRKRGQQRQQILERVDVIDFLERLEIENVTQATSDEVKFSCPFAGHAGGDTDPSAYMNDGSRDPKKTSVFKCHGCGRQGNGITFLSEHRNVSHTEALSEIRREYAPDFRTPKGGSVLAEFDETRARHAQLMGSQLEPLPQISWEAYERRFVIDWNEAEKMWWEEDVKMYVSYLFDRGFLASTLNTWKIGFDDISERLVIPVADIDGTLVGIKGRTWRRFGKRAKPKYLILGDREGKRSRYGWMPYEKSRIVFGVREALERMDVLAIWEPGTVVLVEGELDVLALWQIGIPAISTGSAHLSNTQARIIRDHFDMVILAYDWNTAGTNAMFGFFNDEGIWVPGVIEKLEPFIGVKVVDKHDDDASDMVRDGRHSELIELITGATSSKQLLVGEGVL